MYKNFNSIQRLFQLKLERKLQLEFHLRRAEVGVDLSRRRERTASLRARIVVRSERGSVIEDFNVTLAEEMSKLNVGLEN